MRMRGAVAAVAGVVGAACAHALDEAGLLPGVHESEQVREALTPPLTVLWLVLAGGIAWLAARTRPMPVGAVGAVAVAGIPELVGRQDPGAAFAPVALAGAALQWLLLVVVLALLVIADRHLSATRLGRADIFPIRLPATSTYQRVRMHLRVVEGQPRAPPWRTLLHNPNQVRREDMTARRRGRFAAVAIIPLFALAVACGGSSEGDEGEEGEGSSTSACPASISETASTQLPDDIPAPEDAESAYQYGVTGATKAWFFAVDGGPDDLADVRDAYVDQLEGADYEIEDEDAEEGAEAEAEFKGAHEGTVVVNNLCEGKVGIRIKLTT
jgi:hypothetical protein